MEVINGCKKMQERAESLRMEGRRIAFVPTMGYLHDGHLNLMKEGKKRGDCLVISIFVNPTQFAPGEDFEKYPRDFERDERLAAEVGVDIIFYPTAAEMYGKNYQTYVTVENVTKNLCGRSRPTHFRGVATVCTKLFNIVKPHAAVFGKKDFQQLVTIKRMVTDLDMDLEIVGMDTTREHDGLAMSSRNAYLKEGEREAALSLSRGLKIARDLYESGERDAARIIDAVRNNIEVHECAGIDYISICDTQTLENIEHIDREAVIALAVRVGLPRLIDNYVFGEPLPIP